MKQVFAVRYEIALAYLKMKLKEYRSEWIISIIKNTLKLDEAYIIFPNKNENICILQNNCTILIIDP